jgi:hypothetical protein
MPPEILQILLNLAEFMEHDDKPLPIDIKVKNNSDKKDVRKSILLFKKTTDLRRVSRKVCRLCKSAALQGNRVSDLSSHHM